MKLLLIAPDQPNLLLVPEVREITATHHAVVLNGKVTVKDVFDACKQQGLGFKTLHFSGHGSDEGLELSNGEVLTPKELGQLCRMAKIEIIFLNACNTGVSASYATRHGARYAIFGIRELEDDTAWQMPLAFYNALRNGHSEDVVGALEVADDGSAYYGWTVSPSFLSSLILELKIATEQLLRLEKQILDSTSDETFKITRSNVAKITSLYLFIVTVLVVAIFIAANWGAR